MAFASKNLGIQDKQHVAIIGDGALTGGMAFEGLNHAGVSDTNLLIILNDNCMSIDPNVGALKDYLTDITTSNTYNRLKDDVWNLLGKLSTFGKSAQEIVSKIETGIKSTLLSQSNLFESLHLRYFGPVDGHDVDHLVAILEDLKKIKGPKILHCITVKGKGYGPAEQGNATTWHSPGTFDKITGEIHKKIHDKPQAPKYQDVFGHTLVELAKLNDKIVGITPAMPSGSSLNIMMKEMPDRAIDVGIAEQHAVTFSAGLATQGLIPFCNIYSSFMQRAYDQVVHDVAIQSLPVRFAIDRAGLVGADGATHAGSFDNAYLGCLPNFVIMAASDEAEMVHMVATQVAINDRPSALRYPRGEGRGVDMPEVGIPLEVGKGRIVRQGNKIALLSFGTRMAECEKAADELAAHGLSTTIADARFMKPLDVDLVLKLARDHEVLLTIEEGSIGGFGSHVMQTLSDNGMLDGGLRMRAMILPDEFIDHDSPNVMYAHAGLDAKGIVAKVFDALGKDYKAETVKLA